MSYKSANYGWNKSTSFCPDMDDLPEEEKNLMELFSFFDEHRPKPTPQQLLDELESTWLEVVLIPAPDPRHTGHCIRVAHQHNPLWYKAFCLKYNRSRNRYRKPDTLINRAHTIRALRNMINGKTSGIYVERLKEFIDEYKW